MDGDLGGMRAQEYLLIRSARLRLSCSRCLARFSGRISRSDGDSSPREKGVPSARRSINCPATLISPFRSANFSSRCCDDGTRCGPAPGTGNV